jgi:hypothetical protein
MRSPETLFLTLCATERKCSLANRIKYNTKVESEVYKMFNFSEGVEQRGIAIGLKQGVEQGMELLNQLVALLIRDNRVEDLMRSTTDAELQKQLLHEYQLDEI